LTPEAHFCSLILWGPDFTDDTLVPLKELLVTKENEALVAMTTDEKNPAAVDPHLLPWWWIYHGRKVTQYWKKPSPAPDLHLRVNARYCYWKSEHPIPGGIAFENFELRERFAPGQRFIFGITTKTPKDLGSRVQQ